jgi:IclR family transcriptional regulator, KDG regulon repressor
MSTRNQNAATSPTGTQAIERGLTLVELVGARPSTVRELVEQTGLPRSTVTRLLGALESFHYVARRDDGTFALGSAALKLAAQWNGQFGVERAAIPHLEEMVNAVHETGHVTIREGLQSVCVAVRESPQSIRLSMSVGAQVPLNAGAHARALLAHAPPSVLEALLEGGLPALTPRTVADREALLHDLERIRVQGYAESYGEIDAGAYALAAPIRDSAGQVVAAIGVSGPTERMLELPKEKLKADVIGGADLISRDLGFPR